jgi:hypothetical protein
MLRNALLDIRASANDADRVYFLADVFHVLPSILEKVADEPTSFDKALQLFHEWVADRGDKYVSWFDETVELTKSQLASRSNSLE